MHNSLIMFLSWFGMSKIYSREMGLKLSILDLVTDVLVALAKVEIFFNRLGFSELQQLGKLFKKWNNNLPRGLTQ